MMTTTTILADLLRRARQFAYAEGQLLVEWRGGDRWVIRRAAEPVEVFNHDGEWEWEPQPSSRTDEFKERTRWSLELATEEAGRLEYSAWSKPDVLRQPRRQTEEPV